LAFFTLDIVINFRTAVIDDGELIQEPLAVAWSYLRGWFFADFVATVPYDLFLAVRPRCAVAQTDWSYNIVLLVFPASVSGTIRHIVACLGTGPAVCPLLAAGMFMIVAVTPSSCMYPTNASHAVCTPDSIHADAPGPKAEEACGVLG